MSVDSFSGQDADGPAARPSFDGGARAMFPLVLKGLALTIATLGIYRFWYMTDVRRFLWGGTEVEGDRLEYTGRGVELFIGFLIALAVMIPFYGAVFLIGLTVGAVGQGVVQAAVSLAIVFLAQFALYRARRYRLTRTVWRGIRFQQSGSGLAYAARSLAWGLAAALTLGLAYPFMRASLERYKMTNTWYGDQRGAFSATGGQLFKRGVVLWLLALALILAPIGAIGAIGFSMVSEAVDHASGGATIIGPGLLAALGLAVILPVYLGVEFRWWADGSSVGPASVRSDLGTFAFFRVYLGYAGIVLLLGLAVAAVGGAFYALGLGAGLQGEDGAAEPSVLFLAAGFALYLLLGLVFAALWQVFVIRPIWRKSFESCAISGLGALMAAQSLEPEASAFGEGVADALDFGGF